MVLTDGPTFTTALADEERIERAKDAANGETFEWLWSGDTAGYPSHSEADMAPCCLLAFGTNGNPQRVDRLSREPVLMCNKWDGIHHANGATYGERTVTRACRRVQNRYESGALGTNITIPTGCISRLARDGSPAIIRGLQVTGHQVMRTRVVTSVSRTSALSQFQPCNRTARNSAQTRAGNPL